MLQNYFLVALRRLRRRPGTTALHVGGLAIGLLCCFLALLYVLDERAYDRHHEHAEQVVRLGEQVRVGDMTINATNTDTATLDAIRLDLPGVEAATVWEWDGTALARRTGAEAVEIEHLVFADASLFDVLTVPVARGVPALAEPGAALITESLAATLFGTADPIGQTIDVTRTGYMTRQLDEVTPLSVTISGLLADPPATSSLSYELIVAGTTPIETHDGVVAALGEGGETYLRLSAMADTTALVALLEQRAETEPRPFGEFVGVFLTPLLQLHYGSQLGGVEALSLFATLAALVVLLACINYANLATALAVRRATEVGVRKVLGAGRRQLAGHFYAESLLLAATAGVVALALAAAVLPLFNAFTGKAITLGSLGLTGAGILGGVVVGTGLIAGAYPAATLARFRAAAVLKGERLHGRGGRRLRQALVVVQFATTAVLLAGAVLVAEQLRYAQTRDLGFRGDQTVVFDLDALGIARQRNVLRDAMTPLTSVQAVSVASGLPGDVAALALFSPLDTAGDRSDDAQAWTISTDAAYLDATGLSLSAGRWLRPGEEGSVTILNERAARDLGLMTDNPATAIGQQISRSHAKDTGIEVIGVVSDFHFASLRREISALSFIPLGDGIPFKSLLAVRLDADDLPGGLAAVEAVWDEASGGVPFVPQFLDAAFAEEYAEDRTLAGLVGGIALVTVLLALFGLLGLSAYAAEQRRKEVGVRKVLGARVSHLVGLLARDFVVLVGLALVVAVPVVVVLAQRWLEDFAYPAPIRPEVFASLALGMLAFTAALVSLHALRAAAADPVHTLRHE